MTISEAQLKQRKEAGKRSWQARVEREGKRKAIEHLRDLGKLGFQGLVDKRFGGDVEAAKTYVGTLGIAVMYRYTRPGFAQEKISPYLEAIPSLKEKFTGERPS